MGQPNWEDRAASVLLRFLVGYGEADLKFRLVEKSGRKGFQMFRTFGGIEAPVGELWIGKSTACFKVSEEELRRLVEEAKRTAPDLSGVDKAPQYLEWRATDVTTVGRQIVGTTVHSWQLRWYFSLLGGPKSFSGGASVTKKGIKPAVTAYWPREREDQILRESWWLESVLGRRVENWRELVDAINWSWVLKRVEELADELKPWIGPERASDEEREGLARRMLGELALLVHFVEARRGKDDEWREEHVRRLARAVEVLSGGRIAGEYADRLAQAIIYYAEGYKKQAKERIDKLAGGLADVPREEVWSIVEFVLGDMYCLARDCARDEVVRKFVAPALELIMLEKARNNELDREEALLIFGEMYATAVAGDGTAGPDVVRLIVGGELGGGAALLRLTTLYLFKQLLPDELKFNVRTYVERGRYNIAATGENMARFNRIFAVTAPSAGGEYLSDKFNEFVEAAKFEVRLGDVRLIDKGRVAADLTISEAGIAVKYNVYLREKAIELQFHSTDRSRVELAARLLRLAGVVAEVQKAGGRDKWYVYAYTDKLAAGREELRKALADFVREAVKNGLVKAGKAEGWLKKLEEGRVLMEGWPKYNIQLTKGALVVRYRSTDRNSIEQEAQRFRNMGLKEDVHFSVKMPEEGRDGYVSVLKEGLAHAARLSVHGKDEEQRRPAAAFVKYILERAEKEGKEVFEKAQKIIEEGKAWGSLKLKDFEMEVEVNGKRYKVKVIDGEAVEEDRGSRELLRIKITAEVDGVRSDYTITYGRRGRNVAVGRAYARAGPDGREADAERYSALIKALTGREPRVYHMKGGRIIIEYYEGHLKGFARYAELADDIEKWLEETRGR